MLVRPQVAAGGYIYLTPSVALNANDFNIDWIAIRDWGSRGLWLRGTGYPVITNSYIMGDGLGESVYVSGPAVTSPNWKISGGHIETLHPASQSAVKITAPLASVPIYRSTLIGTLINVILPLGP